MGLPAHYRIQLRLTSDSEEDRATVPSSCSADRTKRDTGRLRRLTHTPRSSELRPATAQAQGSADADTDGRLGAGRGGS